MKIGYFVIIILMIALTLSLASCTPTDNGTPGDNTDTPDSDIGGVTDGDAAEDESVLALVTDGKAAFRFVTTSSSDSQIIKKVDRTVNAMRKAGIEIENRISDATRPEDGACEIIVGTKVRFRDDGLAVSMAEVGPRGYVIKAVGKSIVIAGGTAELTETAFDKFINEYLGFDADAENITSLSVNADLCDRLLSEYTVDSITLGGKDLSQYVLVLDIEGAQGYALSSVEDFSAQLFDAAGYYLDTVLESNADNYSDKIVIRYNTAMERYADDGFAAYFDADGSFIIECAFANAFNVGFEKFISEHILTPDGGAVTIGKDFVYTAPVSRVYYSDFGAVGDGVTDDYYAIYNAHVYANQCGQTVYADEGKTYYVHVFHNGTVPVKTNTYLGDAKILIDDRGSEVYVQRTKALYTLARDYGDVNIEGAEKVAERFGEVTLSVGQSTIPWLADVLVAQSLVTFINANHKDFVRNGGNRDSGYSRMDHVIVDENGNVSELTPIIFEFTEITSVRISRVDDTPIVFDGGYFESICCTTVEETDFVNKYHSYARGIMVHRANSTLSSVVHRMTDEPEMDTTNSSYGERKESYPYHAFMLFNRTFNVTVCDMDLTGHATYYEDKSTSSTPVPMGSYDFVLEGSINVSFLRIVQNGADFCDSKYWGIMASNGVKNLYFKDCEISRYDAHRGFWNGTLENVTLGHSFNVIGGGTLDVRGATKMVGNKFIDLRSDYGATFEGDILLTNCELKGYSSYNSRSGGKLVEKVSSSSGIIINSGFSTSSSYLNWDFGFTCYMPQNVVVDNFKSGISKVYVYNNIGNAAFGDDISNKYVITKSITFKNMKALPVCSSENCTALRAIPVITEE